MKERTKRTLMISALVLTNFLWTGSAAAQKRPIDAQNSVIKIHVGKAGAFSAFGHDHDVSAPVTQGEVETSGNPSVHLRVDSRKLKVLDPKESPKNRAEIQQTMEGPEVLDSARFPEIRFQSTSVQKKGPEHWTVNGQLTLHGQTRPVVVDVTQQGERYRGSASFKQTEFGIKPVRVAGGTIRVKDEVKIEFEVELAK